MGIELKIYQEMTNGRGEDRSVLAATGLIKVEDAINWLVDDHSPGYLVNNMSGTVKTIERNRLVITHMYYTAQRIPGMVETGNVDEWNHYGWIYEFVGTPEWYDKHGSLDVFAQFGVTRDFGKIRDVIWTYAKAWGQEYPDVLGTVIDQLTALEREQALEREHQRGIFH